MAKPKLALYWAASCGGCEINIYDTREIDQIVTKLEQRIADLEARVQKLEAQHP